MTKTKEIKTIAKTIDLSKRVNILASLKAPSSQVAIIFASGYGLYVVSEVPNVGSCLLQVVEGTGDLDDSSTAVVDIDDLRKIVGLCKHGDTTLELVEIDDTKTINVTSGNMNGNLSVLLDSEVAIDTDKIIEDIDAEPSKESIVVTMPKDVVGRMTSIPLGRDAYKLSAQDHNVKYATTFFKVEDSRIKMCRYGSKNGIHLSETCTIDESNNGATFCVKNETLDTIVNQLANLDTESMLDLIVDQEENIMYIRLDRDRLKIPANTRIGVESKDITEFDKIKANVENTNKTYESTGKYKVESKLFSEDLKDCASVSDERKIDINFLPEDNIVEISSVGASVHINKTSSAKPHSDKNTPLSMTSQDTDPLLKGLECITTMYQGGQVTNIEGLTMKTQGKGLVNLVTFSSPDNKFYGVAVWKQ